MRVVVTPKAASEARGSPRVAMGRAKRVPMCSRAVARPQRPAVVGSRLHVVIYSSPRYL